MTWHIPEQTLRVYLTGPMKDTDAWSVEAHLVACQACRRSLAAVTAEDAERRTKLDQAWTALADRLPQQGRIRQASRSRRARMFVVGGPAARWAWLAACAVVLVFAVAMGASEVTSVPWLGIVAPAIPLLGVAASYGSGLDDAYEVIAATPAGGLRLLLVRSAVVLAVTTPIALAGGALIGYGSPTPWLLASLALTLATLALGSAIGIERAAAVVGTAWVVAVGSAVVDPAAGPPVVLTPDAAPVLVAAIAVGITVIAARRGEFNHILANRRIRVEASK